MRGKIWVVLGMAFIFLGAYALQRWARFTQRQERVQAQTKLDTQLLPQPRPFETTATTFSYWYTVYVLRQATGREPNHAAIMAALDRHLAMGFRLIRVPVQWNEIERQPGVYSFHIIDKIVERCREKKVQVVLCLGIKAPRYPERHVPHFYHEQMLPQQGRDPQEFDTSHSGLGGVFLPYLTKCLERYGDNPAVMAIQVENEPLELVGPDPQLKIPLEFLKVEVGLVRKMTSKPIMLTMGAGTIEKIEKAHVERPKILETLLELRPSFLGFNFYERAKGETWYEEATPEHWVLAMDLMETTREWMVAPVISELGIEPWLANPDHLNYRDPMGNETLTPLEAAALIERAQRTKLHICFLWGTEFADACNQVGNPAWNDVIRKTLAADRVRFP